MLSRLSAMHRYLYGISPEGVVDLESLRKASTSLPLEMVCDYSGCSEFRFTKAGLCVFHAFRDETLSLADRAASWVDDKCVKACEACDEPFSMFSRRHHCRSCGCVFCAKCTSQRIVLPEAGYTTEVRVCSLCDFYHQRFMIAQRDYLPVLTIPSKFLVLAPSISPRSASIGEHNVFINDFMELCFQRSGSSAVKKWSMRFVECIFSGNRISPASSRNNLRSVADSSKSIDSEDDLDSRTFKISSSNDGTLELAAVDVHFRDRWISAFNSLLEVLRLQRPDEMRKNRDVRRYRASLTVGRGSDLSQPSYAFIRSASLNSSGIASPARSSRSSSREPSLEPPFSSTAVGDTRKVFRKKSREYLETPAYMGEERSTRRALTEALGDADGLVKGESTARR